MFCGDSCHNKYHYSKRNNDVIKNSHIRFRKHGGAAFCSIRSRCNRKSDPSFINYGGRGIQCKISLEEFRNIFFRTDDCEVCQTKLNDDHRLSSCGRTIDRIDNNGHYEQFNLRVVCRACNSRNKRSVKTIGNEDKIILDYSLMNNMRAVGEKYGVSAATICRVVNRKS